MVNHYQKHFGLIERFILNKFQSLYIQKTSTTSNFLWPPTLVVHPLWDFGNRLKKLGSIIRWQPVKKVEHDCYISNTHLE